MMTMSASSHSTCKQAHQRSLVHAESAHSAPHAHTTCTTTCTYHIRKTHAHTTCTYHMHKLHAHNHMHNHMHIPHAHTCEQLGCGAGLEQNSGKLGAALCHLWWWWPSAHCQICAGRSTSPQAPRRVHPAPSPKHAKHDATWEVPKHAKHDDS